MYSFLFCLCVSSFLDRFNTQASARNGHCLNCWKRSRLCASVTTAATLVILNALELGGQDKIIPILEYFTLSPAVFCFFRVVIPSRATELQLLEVCRSLCHRVQAVEPEIYPTIFRLGNNSVCRARWRPALLLYIFIYRSIFVNLRNPFEWI